MWGEDVEPLNPMEWAMLLALVLAVALVVGLRLAGVWPLDGSIRPH
jgi:hypothetical protein